MLELLVIRGKWESMICYIFVVLKVTFQEDLSELSLMAMNKHLTGNKSLF